MSLNAALTLGTIIFISFSCRERIKVIDPIPKTAPNPPQISHIEITQPFADFQRIADTIYNLTFKFEPDQSQSSDSVASFYVYPTKMELPYNFNHLTFHFTAPNWAAPHKVKYQYFMEGVDREWSQPNQEPRASYGDLSHGTYTLRVRAIGATQEWSNTFEYTFTIFPPWWFSWWAYSIYTLAVLTIIIGIFRLALKRRPVLVGANQLREIYALEEKRQISIAQKNQLPVITISGLADQLAENQKEKEISFLFKVHQIVEDHLSDEGFGIAEICHILGISRTQLHRKLKALTGKPTSHIIRAFRLEKAMQLLQTSDLNVSEVAYAVGFLNRSHFTQVFTKEFGHPPSYYKKK